MVCVPQNDNGGQCAHSTYSCSGGAKGVKESGGGNHYEVLVKSEVARRRSEQILLGPVSGFADAAP